MTVGGEAMPFLKSGMSYKYLGINFLLNSNDVSGLRVPQE